MLFPESNRRKESTVSRQDEFARETPGEAPVMPQWRARLLTLTPERVASDEDGPKRLTRHERVPEENDHRGR
jgi:hypothetical protein